MVRVSTGHVARRARAAIAVLVGSVAVATGATAIEFGDGRVQIHGFGEVQVRALDEKFSQELDLAQWYNVLNVEFEADIAPDGFGPFDLVSAYARVEARYDALYTHGFGLFPSINTYGNDAKRLPLRLRDATSKEYSGTNKVTDRDGNFTKPRIEDKQPASLVPKGDRLGFPGYDILFQQLGPDNQPGIRTIPNLGVLQPPYPFDDPAWYANQKVLDFEFAFKDFRGSGDTHSTQILGPWLPKNFVRSIALNQDRGNPFRGYVSPTKPQVGTYVGSPSGIVLSANDDPGSIRHYLGEMGAPSSGIFDRLDSFRSQILFANDSIAFGTLIAPGAPFAGQFSCITMNNMQVPAPTGCDTKRLNQLFDASAFGGDFMGGIVPCVDPTDTTGASNATIIRNGGAPPLDKNCLPFSEYWNDPTVPDGTIFVDPQVLGLTKITGGAGENPFRPAPDVGNLGRIQLVSGKAAGNPDDTRSLLLAQGLYYPSLATRRVLSSGRLDNPEMNFSEADRAWNHGDAQRHTKELKEAYFDIEMLDSRLWLRLGLQNIVWGKTELFRTTDQFNPQDLALASLPSLEESRIALWSARAVYSLYDVGPLEDVRLEFATNLDHYQPADIGACGEPFTPDIVCSLSTGLFAHGLLGVGVVGVDRPDSPWKNPSDLEVGGRIEWRWDRFSFALTDFWGFSDFPYPEAVGYYERAVDYQSGRPLVARLPGQSLGTCGSATAGSISGALVTGQSFYPDATAGTRYSTAYASHPLSVTTGFQLTNSAEAGLYRGGIGTDPGCLRPGGRSGSPNALPDFGDGINDNIDHTNALDYQSANQQLFAWICTGTVGIAASLDPSACAWTVFSSPVVLQGQLGASFPFSEEIAMITAGSQDSLATNSAMNTFASSLTPNVGADFQMPVVSLNALFNDPRHPLLDRLGNHVGEVPGTWAPSAADLAVCKDKDPAVRANCDLQGFDGFDGRVGVSLVTPTRDSPTNFSYPFNWPGPPGQKLQQTFQTLDDSLTNEQRALLGCGPFYGTRCDSSANTTTDKNGNVIQRFYYAQAGGIDFLNMEASALVQAWPGVEGTLDGHTTTAGLPTYAGTRDPHPRQQPGTILPGGPAANTLFGPVCTRFVPSLGGTVKLPGCRGVKELYVDYYPNGNPRQVRVAFEKGYLPSIDGCVIGDQVIRSNNAGIVPVKLIGNPSAQLVSEFPLCSRAVREKSVPQFLLNGYDPATGQPILTNNPANPAGCKNTLYGRGDPGTPTSGPGILGGQLNFSTCSSQLVTLDMLPMIHPTAGCIDSNVWFKARADNVAGNGLTFGGCDFFYERDLVEEFLQGKAALFQNELAAFSWNFLLFLAGTSCSANALDLNGRKHSPNTQAQLRADPQCFDANRPWTPGRCSYATPQFCSNVKGIFSAAGLRRNTITAAGNSTYGRRTFLWHGGGEIVLSYEQRNVLGFSTDFAEDLTKTNWGVEFTWIQNVPYVDNNSPIGITRTDDYNLTISVDRPTFVNFLNANRTFFLNTQWFFNYLPNYNSGFTDNGPFNALFTLAVFTGYFQDRVMPQMVTVYDFNSQSGGLLPNLQYRFTDSFSVTVGMLYFFGHTQLKDMPVNEIAPPSDRVGPTAYKDGVDNLLSLIRKRDEVFMRVRWTF